jgi:hypothetical protein
MGVADQRADSETGQGAEKCGTGPMDHRACQARREADIGADREIDAGCQDDEGEAR